MNINLNLKKMKTHITYFASFVLASFLILLVSTETHATVWTVSNNPNSPGQYTSLQMAVDSSTMGDTILVAGSSTTYGTVDIYWQLTIFGAGFNNPYGSNTTVTTINLNNFNTSLQSSGTKLSGLAFTGAVNFNGNFAGGNASNQVINNVVIERCAFDYYYGGLTFSYYSYSNDTIRNCFFSCGGKNVNFYNTGTYNNIVFHNNIFEEGNINSNSVPTAGKYATVFFKNNLFLNRTSDAFYNMKEIVLENNIFYKHAPQGCSQCTFTKNLTYINNDNTIPYGDNIGSGNFVDTDPEFVNYPFVGGAFSWSYDFHLEGTSPIISQGTDGSDIGLYGGLMPIEFGSNPPIPQMIELTLPQSSVPLGGTLNVNFKAKKQD